MSDYQECIDYLITRYPKVSGDEFYLDIFPGMEKEGQLINDYSSPNPIYIYEDENGKIKRRIMLKNTLKQDFKEFVQGRKKAICSGLSYFGKSNKLAHAGHMNALIFDIDGVGEKEIAMFFKRAYNKDPQFLSLNLPIPTYIVVSGGGVHLYYVFEKSIELYPYIKLQLQDFKYHLTKVLWEYESTSKIKSVQYQSINQGFRMVGSINEKYENKNRQIVAFAIGNKVDIDYLNQFVEEEHRVDLNNKFNTTYTLQEAKEKFPEWYERVIVNRERNNPKGKWNIKVDLYNWWLKQVGKTVAGHRYYTMLATAIYADKCGIPYIEFKKDLKKVYAKLTFKKHTNKLTIQDMYAALEIYGTGCHTTPIKYIERITAIPIERNKRNYRKRETHIKYMNNQRAFKVEMGECTNGGRPSKKDIVEKWQKSNPNGTKYQCIKETGLSKNTVKKWWDS